MSVFMPIPGIVGGAGPGATSQLYLDIIARCQRAGIDRRPPVLMASLRIDLAMEERLLRTGKGIDGYLPALVEAATALAGAGAHFIAIPCNTLHLLLSDLEGATDLPVLSIVDAVVDRVAETGARRVGLLATGATIRTGLYQAGLERRGIEPVPLDHSLQEALTERISREVGQGEAVTNDPLGSEILDGFRSHGVKALVAGCTELKSLMARWSITMPVVDSLDALGGAVAKEMLDPCLVKRETEEPGSSSQPE